MKLLRVFIYILFFLHCLSEEINPSCEGSLYPLHIYREFQRWSEDESFYLYFNEVKPENLIFGYHSVLEDRYTIKEWDICAPEGSYIITMNDDGGNGWGELEFRSLLRLLNNNVLLQENFMPYRENGHYYNDTDIFYFIHGENYNSEYYYTDLNQDDNSWTQVYNTSWSKAIGNTTISQTSLTRYYVMQVSIHTEFEHILNVIVSFKTSAAYIIYCNSYEVMRHHLTGGSITSNTPSMFPNNLTEYQQTITIPKHYFNNTNIILIAIEIHQYQEEDEDVNFDFALTPFYNDHFSTYGMLRNNIHYCDPDPLDLNHGCDVLSDDDITKYFLVLMSKQLNYTVLLPTGKYVWGNAYAITSSSEGGYDPKSWKLYGAIDDGPYILLDIQTDVSFTARRQIKYFSLANNKFLFNKYYLDIVDTSSEHLSLTEFQIVSVNLPVLDGSLQYDVHTIRMTVNVDPIYYIPISSFYTNYTCQPTLPNTFHLHYVTGILSGYPTTVMNQIFTITAINIHTFEKSSFSIRFIAEDCPFPSFISLKFEKNVGIANSGQHYKVYFSNNTLLYDSPVLTSATTYTYTHCVPTDIYRFELYDNNNKGWVPGSLLTISYKIDFSYNPLFRMTLREGNHETYYVNTRMNIYPSSNTWSYIQGNVPSLWYKSNYIPTESWSLLDFSALPESSSNIWLFRQQFQLPSLENYSGFEFRIKAISGYIIYINDHEFYRSHLPLGLISNSTIPIHNQDSFIWITISGSLNLLYEGTNTIAVGLVNEKKIAPKFIMFNSHFLLLQNGESFSRFFGTSITDSPVGTNQNNLINIYIDDYWFTDLPNKNYTTVLFSFNQYRVEYGNKYCITSAHVNPHYDPYSWTISASDDKQNWMILDKQQGIIFSNRSVTNCFYIANNSKPWQFYLWNITSFVHEYVNYYRYAAAEFLLLNENIVNKQFPDFVITPSTLMTTRNIEFNPVQISSKYYSQFYITPSLPEPLILDSTTGNIRGTLNYTLPLTDYTITAYDINRRTVKTKLRLAVTDCDYPNVFFSIRGSGLQYAYYQSYYLKSSQGSIIDFQQDCIPRVLRTHHYCLPKDNYIIELYSDVLTGWGKEGYYEVLNEKQEVLYKFTLPMKHHYADFKISMNYEIAPVVALWKYNDIPSSSIESFWYLNSFDDESWISIKPYHMQTSSSITTYYRKHFSVENIKSYGSLNVYIYTHVAIIAYLNGKELIRENLPNTTIHLNTYGLLYSYELKRYGISYPIISPLLCDNNVLAVEIHRIEGHNEPLDFDASILLTANKAWTLTDGTYEGNLEDDDKVKMGDLYDNNIDTVYSSGPICTGASYIWKFNNNFKQFVNTYSITNGKDHNEKHPTGWILEGSNTNGTHWTLLHTVIDEVWNEYSMTKSYSFFTKEMYNMFKFTSTQCHSQALINKESYSNTQIDNEDGFQLADISYTSKYLVPDCVSSNGYPDTMNNTIVYKNCDLYYEGFMDSRCVNGSFVEEHNNCKLLAPQSIMYSSNQLHFCYEHDSEYLPIIEAAEYLCSLSGDLLPSSITFDPKTCAFTGYVTEKFDTLTLEVILSNPKGNISTTITIISDIDSNYDLIYVIISVVCVLIICIVIGIKYGVKSLHRINSERKSSKIHLLKSTSV